jgi:hypothetical protein
VPWVSDLPRGGAAGARFGACSANQLNHFVIDSRLPAPARPPHLCPWSVTLVKAKMPSEQIVCHIYIQREKEPDDLIPGARKLFCGPHCSNCKTQNVSEADEARSSRRYEWDVWRLCNDCDTHKGLYSGGLIGPDAMQTLHLTQSEATYLLVRRR